MVDYLRIVAEVEAKMAAKSTPPPAEDTPSDPVEPTEDSPDEGATDTQQAPDLGVWRREYIAKEQAGWTPERRQAQEEELKAIEAYRQQRGPASPGPADGIPRADTMKAIGIIMKRLSAIWPDGLEPDSQWHDKIHEAERAGDREAFLLTVKEWEQAETRRVEAHMDGIRKTVAAWSDECRRRFSVMMMGFMRADRGRGISVRPLSKNRAMDKAFHDIRPYAQQREEVDK